MVLEMEGELLGGEVEVPGRARLSGDPRHERTPFPRDRPQFGLDLDVYVVEPPPPEGDNVMSLLLWKPGHRFVPERASYDLTSDPAGADRWLTKEEAAERRARDAQRRADDERAAREAAQRRADAAERRIEELEALIARGR